MIRILLADDHTLFREGLKQLLEQQQDMLIVGEAGTGGEVLDRLRNLQCDLLLLDINMPGLSGDDLISRVCGRYPETQVLVLSMYNEPLLVRRKLRAGAAGYLTKDSDVKVLANAIRKVAAGGNFIVQELAEQIVFQEKAAVEVASHHRLTGREMQILHMLVQGKGLNEIAAVLNISNKTVSTHKVRMMRKMNITSNAELIRYSIANSIVP